MDKDTEIQEKQQMGLDPKMSPDVCPGCAMPLLLCICSKGNKAPPSTDSDEPERHADPDSSLKNKSFNPESKTFLVYYLLQQSANPVDAVSKIEQLLNRAKNMGLDPQKLLRNEGVGIEQKANIEELQRLAQNGDKMAKELYSVAADNIQNRSKLASKHLESIKNPFRTKNNKE